MAMAVKEDIMVRDSSYEALSLRQAGPATMDMSAEERRLDAMKKVGERCLWLQNQVEQYSSLAIPGFPMASLRAALSMAYCAFESAERNELVSCQEAVHRSCDAYTQFGRDWEQTQRQAQPFVIEMPQRDIVTERDGDGRIVRLRHV